MTDLDYGPRLAPQHVALIEGSAISVAVALERGYFTATDKKELAKAGFRASQQLVPALVIPMFNTWGEQVSFQSRPDEPRLLDGRKLKYETPRGAANVLDVHPSMTDLLRSDQHPLLITEGVRKADAAVSAWRVPTIALAGVWAWRGKNDKGGLTASGEWERVHLRDRAVLVVFDSDVMCKEGVYAAMVRLGAMLSHRQANVRFVYLPDGPNGAKVGLDDWIAGEPRTFQDLIVLSTDTPIRAGSLHLRDSAAHVHTPTEPPGLAREPRILDLFQTEIRRRKLVGEERNAKLTLLAITSRLLPEPVSIALKGHSASGKSFVVKQVAKFFPDDAVITFTAVSDKTLVHSKQEYRHKTILFLELTGMKENDTNSMTSYFVRTLLSEGRIDYEHVIRAEDGTFDTVKVVKEGPTGLILTTTALRLHPENETRLLSLSSNDSSEQTAEVIAAITNGAEVLDVDPEWIQLQRWLEGAERRIVIPYAQALGKAIAPVAVRLRRDVTLLLGLIKAHALLHQLSRDRDEAGAIVATCEDYAVVRALVSDAISDGVDATVSPKVRETVGIVAELQANFPEGVPAAQIVQRLKLDRSVVNRRLHAAEDKGYLKNEETRQRQPGRWKTDEALPENAELLPLPEAVCTCAVESQTYKASRVDALAPMSDEDSAARKAAVFAAHKKQAS